MSFLSTSRLTGREPLVFLPGPFPNEPPTGKAHLKQCEQMTLTRRQKRLCRREPGLAETLRESVRLSLLECRYQFRNERWNCSLDGRGSLLKRGKLTRPSKAETIKLRSLYSSLVRQVHLPGLGFFLSIIHLDCMQCVLCKSICPIKVSLSKTPNWSADPARSWQSTINQLIKWLSTNRMSKLFTSSWAVTKVLEQRLEAVIQHDSCLTSTR